MASNTAPTMNTVENRNTSIWTRPSSLATPRNMWLATNVNNPTGTSTNAHPSSFTTSSRVTIMRSFALPCSGRRNHEGHRIHRNPVLTHLEVQMRPGREPGAFGAGHAARKPDRLSARHELVGLHGNLRHVGIQGRETVPVDHHHVVAVHAAHAGPGHVAGSRGLDRRPLRLRDIKPRMFEQGPERVRRVMEQRG